MLKVIGSSDKVHVVDALAITGEEGRGSLRKAAGSWQTSFDPQISEWGNPPLHRWLSTKAYLLKREGMGFVVAARDDKSSPAQASGSGFGHRGMR